jgi:hypothetical protein
MILAPVRYISFFLSFLVLTSFYLLTVGVEVIVALDHTQGHTHTHTWYDSSRRGIDPSQRPLPDNTQHSQQTDIHATRQDSNPQSQQASGRRPTRKMARPPGSAGWFITGLIFVQVCSHRTDTHTGCFLLDRYSCKLVIASSGVPTAGERSGRLGLRASRGPAH